MTKTVKPNVTLENDNPSKMIMNFIVKTSLTRREKIGQKYPKKMKKTNLKRTSTKEKLIAGNVKNMVFMLINIK